ncbi:FIMAH domain-containing protein [Paenibacillus hemerocallicola]|uniref:FIMAH domain-containing protein n=1 Tax=Paenibacillus hemerocallicola TaxID=1172614 RepID=UPI003CCC5F2C
MCNPCDDQSSRDCAIDHLLPSIGKLPSSMVMQLINMMQQALQHWNNGKALQASNVLDSFLQLLNSSGQPLGSPSTREFPASRLKRRE